jgi:hypothetical protein
VNGKNSGAYVGFRSFAIVNGAPFLQSGEHAWEELYMIKVGNACYKGGNAKLDEFINQSDPQVFTDEEFARDQIMSEISDTVNAANASKSAVGK